jgi:hypothetical protein
MKISLFASLFAVLLVFTSVTHAAKKRPLFVAPPLSAFDGKQWGNLKIGQTTFKEIQPLYETGTGDFERSTELTQAKSSPMRIDCLWYKDIDNREVLAAITVQFKGGLVGQEEIIKAFGPPKVPEPLVQIQLNMDEPEEEERPLDPNALGMEELPEGVDALYQAGRYEEWRVLRFPSKGVAAFQMRVGDTVSTPMLLFATKEGIGTLTQKLSAEYSPVEQRFDPNEGKPKIADFSNVYVDYDLRKGLFVPQSWRDSLKDRIQSSTADGTLRYRRAGGGTYKLSVVGKGSAEAGGSFSVKATIGAMGPYGPIDATGEGSSYWSRSKQPRDAYWMEKSFRDAAAEAMSKAEDAFARQINNSGPPPLSVIRKQQWDALINTVRNYSGLAPIQF